MTIPYWNMTCEKNVRNTSGEESIVAGLILLLQDCFCQQPFGLSFQEKNCGASTIWRWQAMGIRQLYCIPVSYPLTSVNHKTLCAQQRKHEEVTSLLPKWLYLQHRTASRNPVYHEICQVGHFSCSTFNSARSWNKSEGFALLNEFFLYDVHLLQWGYCGITCFITW